MTPPPCERPGTGQINPLIASMFPSLPHFLSSCQGTQLSVCDDDGTAEFYRSLPTCIFLEYFCLHLCELSWLEVFLYHFSLTDTNSDTWALDIVGYRVPIQYQEGTFIFQLYIPLTLYGWNMIYIIVILPGLSVTLKRMIATQHSFIYFDSQS